MTEIESLREEIAKLRERIAVLEARPSLPPLPPPSVPYTPHVAPPNWQWPHRIGDITCGNDLVANAKFSGSGMM